MNDIFILTKVTSPIRSHIGIFSSWIVLWAVQTCTCNIKSGHAHLERILHASFEITLQIVTPVTESVRLSLVCNLSSEEHCDSSITSTNDENVMGSWRSYLQEDQQIQRDLGDQSHPCHPTERQKMDWLALPEAITISRGTMKLIYYRGWEILKINSWHWGFLSDFININLIQLNDIKHW